MGKRRLTTVLSIDVVGYSKMMEQDSSSLLAALNSLFRSVVAPCVETGDGRIVKLAGDGAIAEFPSAFNAVSCVASIQQAIRADKPSYSYPKQIFLRIGAHAGDIVSEGDDIFGDCVNIAARLQAHAEAGGVLISRTVADLAGGDLPVRLRREGSRRLKNLSDPVETLSVDFTDEKTLNARREVAETLEIKFCRSKDGHTLAWTSVGDGPPIVRAPAWISHLELMWRDPGLAHWLASFSARNRLVYFDARGNGLSDWEMETISLGSMVDDLESVFDAAGVGRAPILSNSQGCAIAASFAVRAPERVSAIVMVGGYAVGRAKRRSQKDRERAKALQAMMAAGWDDEYPSLRDLIADVIVPQASNEDRAQFAKDMLEVISPQNLSRYREVIDNFDITELLPRIQVPCLVLHCKDDRMHPIEQGRILAAGIPDARFITLNSDNHNITENDPCWPVDEREIHAFLNAYRD